MAVPSGTVTFLFTDIEGSTRFWQRDEAVMRAALERHDAILRSAIEGCGGYVFSTGGDGFGAAFARAGDAVAAALEAQRGLSAEQWPARAPLKVRMGLHTGEAAERDGDYFGTAVNRAARLMAVAHGGQVVSSAVTAGLVEAEVELADLGEHRLRDLDRPMRVLQVGGGTFGPLRSLDVLPGNLPSPASSFVGRQDDLVAVAEVLGSHRLVTVTGVGGVGKTRLGLQVAADLVARFADGAWLCELAAASTAEELAQVVAVALGVVQRQQMSVADSIVDFLRTRQLLVVLDNCEHLLDAVAELAQAVLAGAPEVRILATSREGLGTAGEHVWPLGGLSVPSDPRGVRDSDAVILFAERAQAVTPGFVLDEARTPGVVEVCRRLDGIPLAIELAAARVAVMTPAEVAAHLDERFRLLTGGRRGQVERHQTLRAAVEWSYSLLSGTERTVFDRLGVFPASFDEGAAVAVCGGERIERWDVIDALGSLVAKSMIVADQSGEPTRYQLLETLRHFARESSREDLERLRRRHAAYYAEFAERAGAGLASHDELLWRPRLAAELDNLRAAAGWAFDAASLDDVALGVGIIDGLMTEASTTPSWGIHPWADPALARVDQLSAAQRAVVHAAAAVNGFYLGQFDRARRFGDEVIAESQTFTAALLAGLFAVSFTAAIGGDPVGAMAVFAEGRRRVETDGSSDWLACSLQSLTAWLALSIGDRETATSEAQQAVVYARRVGSPSLLAHALGALARGISDQNPDEALAAAEESVQLIEAGAGDNAYSGVLQSAALLRSARGDTARAARAITTAIGHEARIGNRLTVAANVAVAVIVLVCYPDGFNAAATLGGALGGPVLQQFPAFLGGDHQDRYEHALAQAAAALGQDDYFKTQQLGAAMTYDEIVAYTLEQLDRRTNPWKPSTPPGLD